MIRLLGLVVIGVASVSSAYDSKCYRVDAGVLTPCRDGYESARERWIGPSDEHRKLLQEAAQVSGIPAGLFVEEAFELFVSDAGLPDGFASVAPVPFEAATSKVTRRMSVPEFAQLPDFSYSLADWATGNETCPLDAVLGQRIDPVACHTFFGHMGAANANHFVPQSENMYRHYHQLALERAAVCRRMKAAVSARHVSFVESCQRQALIFEAIGQHFLQDAWSTGHMWERWGSANPADAPSFLVSTTVAGITGLFHGTRGVMAGLEESQPGLAAGVVFDDALCAPHPEVTWSGPQAAMGQAGVGDLYAADLLTNSSYAAQRAALFSCAVSGLRAVYEAAGETPGPTSVTVIDPTSAACFDQRVSNLALQKGAGIDATVSGKSVFIPLTPELATTLLFSLRASGARPGPLAGVSTEELETLSRQVGFSLSRIASQLMFFAKNDPLGDSLARGVLHPLATVEANSAYAFRTPPAPYADTSTDAGGLDVARAFHRAFATEWCAMSQQDLEALRQHVQEVPDAGRAGACAACVEFAGRHLRLGDAGSYDTSREPLCHELVGSPAYLYDVGATPVAAAEHWCTCGARCAGGLGGTPRLVLFGPGAGQVTLAEPGSRQFVGGMNNEGTGSAAADYGRVSGSCSVSFSGNRHDGFGVSADWNDFVLVVPDDARLMGQSAVVVGEVEIIADSDAQRGSGRPPFVSASFRSGSDEFSRQVTDGGTFPAVNRLDTMRWSVRLGSVSPFNGALRANCGFTGSTMSPASGSSRSSISARWVRLLRIETSTGMPVAASLCSLSGKQY